MSTTTTNEPLTTGAAARLADRSAETIRAWERRGWLAAQRTTGGIRLFDAEEVKRVATERDRSDRGRA